MLSVLGCIAASGNRDQIVFAQGNPKGFYFLGNGISDEVSADLWFSCFAYDLIFSDYILMKTAKQGSVGYWGFLACERTFDFSKFSQIEVVVETPSSLSDFSIGTVSGIEIGTEGRGASAFSQIKKHSGVVPANTTFTETADISAVTGILQPAIRIGTTYTATPNVKIKSWRLLR